MAMQFCTTSSREYLPFARALARALHEHQGAAELFVLLLDDLDHEVEFADEPFTCVRNEEVIPDAAELHRMYLIHGSQFIPAIKPFFIAHLIEKTGLPTIYLDSDMVICGAFSDLGELIERHGVLLTPHVTSPLPDDRLEPDDTTILSAGTFNAGLMGYGRKGLPALEYLMARLRRECVTDISRQLVNEQRWLDQLPSYFDVAILRDPGVNTAYWNLHERPLRREDGRVFAGDAPLRALHLSGYDPTNPDQLSQYAPNRPRITFTDQPILRELAEGYRLALWREGYERHRGLGLPFNEIPGGLAVDATLRALYRDAVVTAESTGSALPPDAYLAEERSAFLAWARQAYAAANLPLPSWVGAPTAVAEAGESPSSQVEEMLRVLAQQSAAAIENLDRRLRDLERELGERGVTARGRAVLGADA